MANAGREGGRRPTVYSPYQRGMKYCRRCMAFVRTESRICPRCGGLLRSGPRSPSRTERRERARRRQVTAQQPEQVGENGERAGGGGDQAGGRAGG
ncbi:MAG: hypothetical protein QXP81_06420 [Nitrososphaerota archaeon]